MNQIQENIAAYKFARDTVETHPLCLRLEEDDRYFIVIFPYECQGLGGVRIAHNGNKRKALSTLLDKLEAFWEQDSPSYDWSKKVGFC